ncbi:MAG TPA: O-antigen ligase family protein [Thermoanaerobaculia bacterium]|nr:O-antigen ligase family protein [Thermoanaerobaculia bacterium]
MRLVESRPASSTMASPTSVGEWVQRVGLALLLLEVATAPMWYGAVLPDGKFLLEILAFTTAALATISSPRSSMGWARIPIFSTLALAALGAFQLLGLPHGWISRLSPNSALLYGRTQNVTALFRRPPLVWRISVSPGETASASLLIAAYAALFFSAALLGSSRNRRRFVQGAILAAGIVYAGFAAITEAPIDRIHGPFVNPNHLAGYLEIGLCLAFGLLWTEILVNRERAAGLSDKRERLERRLFAMGWKIILWSVVAAALALTRSRGGISAAVLTSAIVFLLALSRRGRERKWSVAWRSGAILLTGIAVTAFAVGRYPLLRFLISDPRDPSSDLRTTLWKISIEAWRSFPLLGSGLGAFREAFRLVQPADLPLLVEQAHDSFLQILVTGGLIGATLSVLTVGSLLIVLLRAWRLEPHREERSLLLAAAGVLISLCMHDLVEFNFSVPAIPATMAIALGTAWAGRSDPDRLPAPRPAAAD